MKKTRLCAMFTCTMPADLLVILSRAIILLLFCFFLAMAKSQKVWSEVHRMFKTLR